MMPGNLRNELTEARREIERLRGLLAEWRWHYGTHHIGDYTLLGDLERRTLEYFNK